jgi:acyl-coenzyme A synthetase/AMP-(fatty) acid ligase
MNVAHLLDRAAQQHPERTAVYFPGIPNAVPSRTISYRELAEWTSRFAGGLKALGLEPGDRFAVYLPNLPNL